MAPPRSRSDWLRRRAGAAVVDGFFRGIAAAGRLHPNARPERHGVEVVRDLAYLDDGRPEHRLDVYRPAGQSGRSGPLPTVLYVHGGGFRILSKDTHWLMGLAFARHRYLVFNINYRLAPRHPFPAAIADACAAYAWLAREGPALGADLSRLVLAGESAGANLVTALAVAACWPRPEPFARAVFESGVVPRAVLPACGILQVSDVERFARRKKLHPFVSDRLREVRDAYLHGFTPSRPEDLDLADPLVLLERGEPPVRPLPAFFAFVGTADPLLDDTRRLQVAVERLGGTCAARYFPGEPHAFHAFVFRDSARRAWREAYAFLDEHLVADAPRARTPWPTTAT